jgi:hypothetical protein
LGRGFKQQGGDGDSSVENSESESYAAEIASMRERISAEQRETAELKRELHALIGTQEELQRRIEEETSVLSSTLAPLLQTEEAQTQSFYDSVLANCEGIDGIDLRQLRALVDGAQTKRRAVSDVTDENQKIHRLIGLNRAQTERPAMPPQPTGAPQPTALGPIEMAAPGPSSPSPKVELQDVVQAEGRNDIQSQLFESEFLQPKKPTIWTMLLL